MQPPPGACSVAPPPAPHTLTFSKKKGGASSIKGGTNALSTSHASYALRWPIGQRYSGYIHALVSANTATYPSLAFSSLFLHTTSSRPLPPPSPFARLVLRVQRLAARGLHGPRARSPLAQVTAHLAITQEAEEESQQLGQAG